MTREAINRNFEIFAVLLFSVSVFVWKPGIYVSSGIIIAYMLVRAATDRAYWNELRSSNVMRVSMALFVFGLVTATIGMQQPEDLLWMARKTLFLPVAGFLFIALVKAENRKAALIGLFMGFWFVAIRALADNWSEHIAHRFSGSWPPGTWDALLGLFFVFLFLCLIGQKHRLAIRLATGLCTAAAFFLLLLAGGRGPLVAAACAVFVYLIFFKINIRTLVTVFAVVGILTVASASIFQDRAQIVFQRISSITDTNEISNWIRLRLWGIGYAQIKELATEQPLVLLFGTGSESARKSQISFFDKLPYDEADRIKLKQYGYPSGNVHNNYLDSILHNGLLWTVAAFAYLVWLTTRFKATVVSANPAPFTMLIYLLVLGVFYTVVPHFTTFFFVLFVALLSTMSSKQGETDPGDSELVS